MADPTANWPISRITYGTSMGVLGSICVAGYAVYLKTVWGRRDLQKRSIFLMSLCVSDLLMVFLHLTFTVWASLFPHWKFGALHCQVDAVVAMGTSLVSLANVALIVCDTYFRECEEDKHGLNYGFYLTLVWIVSLAAGFLPVVGIASYSSESGLKIACFLDLNDNTGWLLHYLVFITSVWFVYPTCKVMIYATWLKQKTGDGFLLKVIPAQLLISWTPYAVFAFVTVFFGAANVPAVELSIVANVGAKLFYATNPFIHMYSDPLLRTACLETIFGKDKSSFVSDQGNKKSQ